MGLRATGRKFKVSGISIIRFEHGKAVEEWIEEDGLVAHATAWRCEVATLCRLVVRASPEMNVNVAWPDKERNQKKVKYQTYSSIEIREPDSCQGNGWSNQGSPCS